MIKTTRLLNLNLKGQRTPAVKCADALSLSGVPLDGKNQALFRGQFKSPLEESQCKPSLNL